MSTLLSKHLWYRAIPLALLAVVLSLTAVGQVSAVPPPGFNLQQTITDIGFANGLAVDTDDNIRMTDVANDEL